MGGDRGEGHLHRAPGEARGGQMGGYRDRAANLFKKFDFEAQLVVLKNHRINTAQQPGALIWPEDLGKTIAFLFKQTLDVLRSREDCRGETRKTGFRLSIARCFFAGSCADPFVFVGPWFSQGLCGMCVWSVLHFVGE